MALIVEDGTGLDNAQSYATVQAAQQYAAARGKLSSIPSKDADVEALLVQATDFVDTLSAKFSGSRATSTQALEWPRVEAFARGYPVSADSIPSQLAKAVCQLVIDADQGKVDLMPNGEGREVLEMKIEGAASFKYAERGAKGVQPQFYKAISFLEQLFEKRSGGIRLYR